MTTLGRPVTGASGPRRCHHGAVLVVRVVVALAGAALVLSTGLSAVKTVVLPRAAVTRTTRAVFQSLRRLMRLVVDGRSFEVRDRVLAYHGPIGLILLPGVWVVLVLVGFAGIGWGTGMSWREALLTSGSSLLTLGTVFHADAPHAALTFVEATIGLGLVSLQISYLPTIYGAFARREQLVGLLEARAGSPPSPVVAFVRFARIGGLPHVVDELIRPWESWFADIQESHTTLPALVFFRSPQPERSWITAAGCVLDSAALFTSAVDEPHDPRVDLTIRTGYQSLRRIADYFGLPYDPAPRATDPISVTRPEFDAALDEMAAAGVPVRADRDAAWLAYGGWRVNYDAVLLALAALVDAPPAPWSSDRGPLVRPEPRIRRRFRSVGRPGARAPR